MNRALQQLTETSIVAAERQLCEKKKKKRTGAGFNVHVDVRFDAYPGYEMF